MLKFLVMLKMLKSLVIDYYIKFGKLFLSIYKHKSVFIFVDLKSFYFCHFFEVSCHFRRIRRS